MEPPKADSSVDADEWNLTPVITYRHVHSKGSGVHNPLRVIGLCEIYVSMDAFYAQCEQIRLGIDPALPVVVLQWDMLIAVNYPAREFGIKRMTKVEEAKKMCPNLVIVHVATYKDGENEAKYHPDPNNKTHKVSLDLYRRESVKIINIFKTILVGSEVEKASVDECFLDFTVPIQQVLVERYPQLAAPLPSSSYGMDSPLPPPPQSLEWHPSCILVPYEDEEKDDEPPPRTPTTDHSEVDDVQNLEERASDPKHPITWHDIALSIGGELMFKARNEILQTLGYTTSAGVSRNKFLAKLVASYRKPASQSILRNGAIPHYLSPMPFQKIRFLGGKLGAVIADEYQAATVRDLLSVSLVEMQAKFGPDSIWVHQVLRGIDNGEVKEKPPVNKSMLASKNLPNPIRKDGDVTQWVRVLCSELAVRLVEARETGTVWPKTIVLHTKQVGEGAPRSKQAAFPFIKDLTGDYILNFAMKLWKELHGTDAERQANPNAPRMKIINIALAFTGVEALEQGQRGIEGFLGSSKPSSSTAATKSRAEPDAVSEKEAGPSKVSFRCSKCSKDIPIAVFQDDDEETRAGRIEAAKGEHDDYHFAQQLARQDKVVVGGSAASNGKRRHSPSRGLPKKKRKEEVIMSYFQKK